MKEQYQASIGNADEEASRIIEEARNRAAAEYEKVLAQARADAAKKMEEADRTIALEREKAMNDLKAGVAGLAMTAAAKLISEQSAPDSDRNLYNRFLAESANALLKTLEEHPAQTWFFLASREPARLLATLRSRCRLHHLAPPAESYAISWLAREVTASPEALLSALRLSAGSPGAALTLLQAESWAHRTDFCAALGNTLNAGDWYILLAALNHDQAAARLHWLATLLTDALKRPYGVSHLTNPDALDLISSIAERLSVAQIQAILGDVCHCRQQLLNITGINRELVLTDLILRIEHYLQPGTVLPVPHL